MIRKLTYFGGIVFGIAAGLGFLCGSQTGIPSPWYQIATFAALIISVSLLKAHKRYGRVRKASLR